MRPFLQVLASNDVLSASSSAVGASQGKGKSPLILVTGTVLNCVNQGPFLMFKSSKKGGGGFSCVKKGPLHGDY